MDQADVKKRGLELLHKMLGVDQAERVRKTWIDICPDFEEYVVRFLAGEVWSRPGLDRRTKSLVTIATVSSMGKTLALDLNIRMALNNGATREEIVETLLQVAPYGGFPAAWEGLAMAHKIFREIDHGHIPHASP